VEIFTPVKSRRMRYAEHVHMREMKIAYSSSVEKPKGRDHLEDVGFEGMIILEWILWK
jgi:hypothetical protein